MVKGGALLLSIVISFVLGVLSFFLILLGYYNHLEITSWQLKNRLLRNVNSAKNIFLVEQSIIGKNESRFIDLFSSGEDSLFLARKSWGIYEVGVIKAFKQNFSQTECFLLGSQNHEKFALYLSDQDKPLSLGGKTEIKGLCYLPKAGVKRAFIEGQSFTGDKLIDGETRESTKEIPAANGEFLTPVFKIMNLDFDPLKDSLGALQELSDTLNNSHLNKTIILTSKSDLVMDNKFLTGNIIIHSSRSITVKQNNSLKDIILIAPKIKIDNDFSGIIQAFASDTISIGEKVMLSYPSSLCLIRKEKNNLKNGLLNVEKGSRIEGSLVVLDDKETQNSNLLLSLRPETKIFGEIICNGSLDLQGSVVGRVICKKIVLNTSSSVYENHLLNANIDGETLPDFFVFSEMNNNGNKLRREIIKSLN